MVLNISKTGELGPPQTRHLVVDNYRNCVRHFGNVLCYIKHAYIVNVSSQTLAGLTQLSTTNTPMCGMLALDRISCRQQIVVDN